jgi:hypothetical protein
MIRIRFVISLFIVLYLCPVAGSAEEESAKFFPQYGRLLIIGQQQDTIEDYVREIGIVPGGFMSYTSIQGLDGLEAPANHGAGIHHADYLAAHYPQTALQLGLYMVGALDDVLAGSYDANIQSLGNWLKQSQQPVFLRIGYEFDFKDNGYDPKKYEQAYRYIVDRLRAQGVDNVAYVWHSAASMNHAGNFMEWYPGDNYVDWFAVSYFSPLQTKTVDAFAALAVRHGKPLMIAESTPAGFYTSRGRMEWFSKFFDLIQRRHIRVVSYINSRWDGYPMFKDMKWGDARIQADPEIRALWKKKMGSGEFLQSSPDLFKTLSYGQENPK